MNSILLLNNLQINNIIKETKERIKRNTLESLDDCKFNYVDDIEQLIKSGRSLSENEKLNIMLLI